MHERFRGQAGTRAKMYAGVRESDAVRCGHGDAEIAGFRAVSHKRLCEGKQQVGGQIPKVDENPVTSG